jgi:hypothetical protein
MHHWQTAFRVFPTSRIVVRVVQRAVPAQAALLPGTCCDRLSLCAPASCHHMTVVMKKSSLVLAACALLVALGALAASLMYTPFGAHGRGRQFRPGACWGEFEATDHNGKRVTNKDFEGKYALYYFGFTYCPDICPAELQVISAALNEIPDASDKDPGHLREH